MTRRVAASLDVPRAREVTHLRNHPPTTLGPGDASISRSRLHRVLGAPDHVELVRDLRPALDVPGHVDLVVAAVGADPEGAPEPAPEAELALLHQLALEVQLVPADGVVLALPDAHAVDEDAERRAHAARKPHPGRAHGPSSSPIAPAPRRPPFVPAPRLP